ncbi:proline-rich domain-containing protein [Streptomyces caelestis]|uniref:Proline-rich domain-containing protein n=1 Tax=Streptomyces heliomycini TaxID=284032 RepID=A0ABV5LGT8_9ACTN|nr:MULTISPECIES: proline-rich domain-containing protein [Streptomyces]
MARASGRWTGGTLRARTFLKPHHVARAVFHPAWIPQPLDPSIERLKRFRVIAGAVASIGVYTVLEGGFDVTELLENALTASAVLLLLTPLTVGVMLFVWRRTGTVRRLRAPLLDSLKLLLLFIGCVVALVLLVQTTSGSGSMLVTLGGGLTMMWMIVFVISGAVRVSGNFFGTAAVHRCLPALLATVTSWLMAIPDLVTGDLHGLGLTMGVVFVLGAPVTVTAIALAEAGRLKRRYGIRLGAHPAGPPPVPGPVPPVPPAGLPHVPPQGNPYAPHPRHPYVPGAGGNPYAPGTGGNPYAGSPQPPSHPQRPHGLHGG